MQLKSITGHTAVVYLPNRPDTLRHGHVLISLAEVPMSELVNLTVCIAMLGSKICSMIKRVSQKVLAMSDMGYLTGLAEFMREVLTSLHPSLTCKLVSSCRHSTGTDTISIGE